MPVLYSYLVYASYLWR